MRDRQLENELLDLGGELNQRAHLEDPGAYARTVFDRLALGARVYGDLAFLEKDNLQEALQESPDLGAYALLELQRLRPQCRNDSDFQEIRMAAVALIAAAIHADQAARRFLDTRRELFGS